ncbi:TonB-dependent receptor [Chitinophagaceae bacterium LB-8]|uniref:TonB-dependent receptor n=1 Tax=Paraflavisolibacter caeni TaxID=2982496 RepID=A0A9X2XU60_9BACT|nr:TonB-dependent receptor [Paraflavisolibacter caeni]MCU7549101.1 TonB-dependent receptor [Paraflavisolibacter caeni]
MQILMRSFILCGLLSGISTYAQEAEVELDPVTITASINPIKVSKTGRNIVILKGEQFSKLPVHSIDELLRYIPGVEIQARGPQGSQSDIVLRGGTFQQVLVVIDGIRLNDPNTGHFTSYIPIAPSEIERIEVLKGASSAIYGSEAVGGVIHIITKSFAAAQKTKKEATAQVTAGEYKLLNANAGAFYSNGKTAVSGGILSNNSDGQPQRGTKGFFHNNTVSVSANHLINQNWQLGLRSSYDSRDFAAQNFYTRFASDTASEKVQTFWNQMRLAYSKNSDKLSLSLGYKGVEDEYLFRPGTTPNNSKSKLLQALLVHEHQFGSQTSLVSGAQFQNKNIKSNDRGNHTVKQVAGFVALNQSIGQNFTMNPALRLDWDERGGTEWVPQMNLSYRIHKLQLRGSAGKTIRQADFTERYNNYNKPVVISGSIGNPDLTAETSFSYELGADLLATDHLKFSASWFQRNQDDLIDYVTTPYSEMPRKTNLVPNGIYALAKNISEVTTKGFETDIQFSKPLSANESIYSTVGLIWLDSKSSEATPSFYISSHASFLANYNFIYTIDRFSFGINGIYKKRQPQTLPAIHANVTSDYFVANIKADASILKNKLSVFVEVDNLFDRNYSDLLGSQMPGRWFMGGLKVAFSK